MSREISADFKSLKDFLDAYSLKKHVNNIKYLDILSKQHKKYFAFLTCIAELTHIASSASATPSLTQEQISYLKESCSDIGNAYFVMIHGAYKPSRLMLRSSIETFLKGFNLDDYPGITTEKSLYRIFETIKELDFFQQESVKVIFDEIHACYGKLCEDTHTATELNMKHITALNYFPEFDENEATAISNFLSKLVKNYITLICIKYKNYYFKMHHKSQENIIENIEKSLRPLINGIKE